MLIDRDPPVNWNALVLQLRRWGWTLKGIAATTNIPHSTILGWCNEGKEPLFEQGRALVKFYEGEAKKRSCDPSLLVAGLQPAR